MFIADPCWVEKNDSESVKPWFELELKPSLNYPSNIVGVSPKTTYKAIIVSNSLSTSEFVTCSVFITEQKKLICDCECVVGDDEIVDISEHFTSIELAQQWAQNWVHPTFRFDLVGA